MLRSILAAVLALPLVAAAQLKADFDLGSQWKVNSTARLMSGLTPMHPAHVEFSHTDAWQQHSATMTSSWNRLRDSRIAAMTAWRDEAVSKSCPVGKTLLYPFSGPDFFNAYWMFPECETFVMFGLEPPGGAPELERLSEKQMQRLIDDVRIATGDLFQRNYFITERMARQLHTAHLRGVVPLVMISMALSGIDILRVAPYDIGQPRREPPAGATGKPMRNLKGVTVEFRVPGSPTVRRMIYFSVDATDHGLAHYPEFVDWLKTLGPTTTFVKSASYLLHGSNFSLMRKTVLEVSGFIVQDDSGVPFWAFARDWEVRVYGRYGVPIPPFKGAFQPALDKVWKVQNPQPLPFTFGYQYNDRRDERSHVIVARRVPGAMIAMDDTRKRITAARRTSAHP